MARYSFVIMSGLVLTGLLGISNAQPPRSAIRAKTPISNPQQQLAAVDSRLIAANTQFGFKLFDRLAKQDAGKNIFVSPSSVAFALAMVYNGAGGETQRAMAKALELNGMSLQEINQANAALQAMLSSSDSQLRLTIANSLWTKKGITFKPAFLKRNQQFYAAELAELDFAAPSAIATINNWVRQNTNGKIAKIVDQIPNDAILYLINAIYFKGNWARPFDKAKTREGQFTLLHGAKKQHPMMSQSGYYRYFLGDKFQAISLPYGGGKKMSMYIFLPAQDSNLNTFLAGLNVGNWSNWMKQFRSQEGDIVLPRFKLEYEVVLNNTLKALGMEAAFDPQRANFREMYAAPANVNVFLGEVKHKTFVEVNEEGTEAAAVTSGGMRATAYIPRFSMVVDRPFFCAIQDDQSGTVLFMGAIVEPM